jgi:hypothetical protein
VLGWEAKDLRFLNQPQNTRVGKNGPTVVIPTKAKWKDLHFCFGVILSEVREADAVEWTCFF